MVGQYLQAGKVSVLVGEHDEPRANVQQAVVQYIGRTVVATTSTTFRKHSFVAAHAYEVHRNLQPIDP